MDARFGEALQRLRTERGVSLRALASRTAYSRSYLSQVERGDRPASTDIAARCDAALNADGALLAFLAPAPMAGDDETEALDLARRVAATDVGAETISRVESAVDDLATLYPSTPPAELLIRVRHYLGYVSRLMDARKTLDEHRRLLMAGAWLSLLAGTLHIDLHQRPAAAARLMTARQLAHHAEDDEIAAWCLETRAWDAVTEGRYGQAVALSQAAQELAPRGSSAHIQATAQAGRAWARLGDQRETRVALTMVSQLVGPLSTPDRPEHDFRYDPAKATASTATTLAWLGDAAAEPFARDVLARLDSTTDGDPRPRRAASARLDLALALLAVGKPDEAAEVALQAILSGRLVPSNYWRAEEVVTAVSAKGIPEAGELHEAFQALCRTST